MRYANYFSVGHRFDEVVLEFGQTMDNANPSVHTRIVTSPNCANTLLSLLRDSLDQYRGSFGPIPEAKPHE